eukprot:GHVS01029008.1.p1 GENE.GHVS01029008.1~~GHVS01029008.1.p1  ORF type:complete len:281 (+),score=46.91 GHVS01029008.1:199-1041(+)
MQTIVKRYREDGPPAHQSADSNDRRLKRSKESRSSVDDLTANNNRCGEDKQEDDLSPRPPNPFRTADEETKDEVVKEKPNFEASGLLAAETNTKNGIVLKYCVPAEARNPTDKWRMYMFKKDQDTKNEDHKIDTSEQPTKVLHLHRQQCYLFGKESRVCDIYMLHPTISKQHAVVTYRYNQVRDIVIPYLMDLESTNGTFLNDERIDACRYYELCEQDTVRFGRSSREYVLLHAGSVDVDKIDYDDFINLDKLQRMQQKELKEQQQKNAAEKKLRSTVKT